MFYFKHLFLNLNFIKIPTKKNLATLFTLILNSKFDFNFKNQYK